MTEIYLCDDEAIWIDKMEQAVLDFTVGSDWELSIVCKAPTPGHLLDCLSHNETWGGIYFLDIGFKSKMNGIELGVKIRESDPEAVLIFVTYHDEMVMDTFRLKLQATDYILKDRGDIRSQIFETLRTVEDRYDHSAKKLSSPRVRFYANGSYHFLFKNDIYYVESQKNQHKLFVHMKSEVFTVAASLKDVEHQLGGEFIICRRGCLVNPVHVVEANQTTRELIFDNKERCRCSFRTWHLVVDKILPSVLPSDN